MVRLLVIILMIIISVASAIADVNTEEKIFSPRFRTLKTQLIDYFDAPPIIRLGTNDRIEITFDEIGEDISYPEYRLIHCNADWQPSQLLESEYLRGFNAVDIEDAAYSTATYIHYVNYRIEIPNENTEILQSGNYLLQVYDSYNPDDIILQTRFRVSENTSTITGLYNARTDRGYNDEWQQLELTATVDLTRGENPYSDYRLELQQNNNRNTDRTISVPSRVNGNNLIYSHLPDLIFTASNEFRRFESVSNTFPGMNVDSLRYMGNNYHVWLKPDEPKFDREYQYDRTQHGRFLVREWNATDSNIGADYITVHFMLKTPEISNADIFVDGEMIYGELSSKNKMEYDRSLGAYTLQIPLKQGAYNYQYLIRDRNSGTVKSIDGNKWETGNQYTVLLWKRSPGERADRLIGTSLIE